MIPGPLPSEADRVSSLLTWTRLARPSGDQAFYFFGDEWQTCELSDSILIITPNTLHSFAAVSPADSAFLMSASTSSPSA